MQHDEDAVERIGRRGARFRLCRLIVAMEHGLREFKEPVAENIPRKLINRVCRVVETIGRERLLNRLLSP